jgi:UDP-2-acetamido-2,6-beta-L-arabino-hexul-4-ose reductase
MRILVTGAKGFIGRNLMFTLGQRADTVLDGADVDTPMETLLALAEQADAIIHLAGANRPPSEQEFETCNVGLTEAILARLGQAGRAPLILFSSSTQAELSNPYGLSKRRAEDRLRVFAETQRAPVRIFRLTNVFGKWSRPNYNTVVATFCHNLSRGLPITISDPTRILELIHVDDVIAAFCSALDEPAPTPGCTCLNAGPIYTITLGELAERLRSYQDTEAGKRLPDLADRFTRLLFSTFLSFRDLPACRTALDQKTDPRGALAELLKSPHTRQVFASRTRPGITRGNHYHHTKSETFWVLEGTAVIRIHSLATGQTESFTVRGADFTAVAIPPGCAHSITNIGETDLITLFWTTEIFDPSRPDTYAFEVPHD